MNTTVNTIATEILNTLNDLGGNIQSARPKIQAFLTSIQPSMSAAIASKDSLSMSYLRDRTSMAVAQISLDLSAEQQQAVINTTITVLRILIAIGIAAI